MSRYLVTGGSGFIGTNLMERLTECGDVLSLDPRPPRSIPESARWVEASVLDLDAISRTIRDFGPTHVIHLGARTDLRGTHIGDYDANIVGVRNVIDAVGREAAGTRMVFASSRLVFEIGHKPDSDYDYRPSTPYGESKVRGEQLVRSHASNAGPWCIVRPTSIWGPWFDEPYRDFFDMIAAGRYVNFTGRDPMKSFGFVGNSVHQLIKIANADEPQILGQVFWLSDYEPLRLSVWAGLISTRLDRRPPRSVPWSLGRAAARAGDLLARAGYRRPPLTTFRLNNLVTDMVYDTSRTRRLVGPLPYDLEAGVDATVDWYKEWAQR